MANLVMTGFEWGTIYELSHWERFEPQRVALNGTSIYGNTASARTGNYSLYVGFGAYDGYAYIAHPDRSEIYVQFALKFPSEIRSSLDSDAFYRWYGTDGDFIYRAGYLSINMGRVLMYLRDWDEDSRSELGELMMSTDVLSAVGTKVLQPDKWYVFELHLSTGPGGPVHLRIDGETEFAYGGPAGEFSFICQHCWYAFWGYFIDDVVINDTSGSENNSWPDGMRVILLRPDDPGDFAQWTPSQPYHNYDNVNEVPIDATNYVYTTTDNLRDLYNLESLPNEVASIVNVRSDAWMSRGSASTVTKVIYEVKPGSTVFSSSPLTVPPTTGLVKLNWEVNPETGLPWTVEEVNRLQAGFRSKLT